MRIQPINNQTNNQQKVNFQAVYIPPKDEQKVISYLGEKLYSGTARFTELPWIEGIYYIGKEIKKAWKLPIGDDIRYLLNKAKQAKKEEPLTWERCQKVFTPYEEAKKVTAAAKEAESSAYNDGLKTLGII